MEKYPKSSYGNPNANSNGSSHVNDHDPHPATDRIPHRGSLFRVVIDDPTQTTSSKQNLPSKPQQSSPSFLYAMHIMQLHNYIQHELRFTPHQYTFMERIFTILDTESVGLISKQVLYDFVMLRCPVFQRRDRDMTRFLDKDNLGNKKDLVVDGVEAYHGSGDEMGGSYSASGGVEVENNPDVEKDDPSAHVMMQGEMYGEGIGTSLKTSHNANTKNNSNQAPSTFEQIWKAVLFSAINIPSSASSTTTSTSINVIGIEAWMLFCKFISLAQYHDAKRRFSARHLQQTLHNQNGSENELIIVDLPPLEQPVQLTVESLMDYEAVTKETGGIPLPELDLDHSYVSIHDESRLLSRRLSLKDLPAQTQANSNAHILTGTKGICTDDHTKASSCPVVEVSVFSSGGRITNPISSSVISGNSTSTDHLEFIIRFKPNGHGRVHDSHDDHTRNNSDDHNVIIVRRSFADLEWLHKTFKSHKQIGGTLCGRILPPFPSRSTGRLSSSSDYDETDFYYHRSNPSSNITAVAVASAGVGMGMMSSAAKTAKSLWGSLSFSGSRKSSPARGRSRSGKGCSSSSSYSSHNHTTHSSESASTVSAANLHHHSSSSSSYGAVKKSYSKKYMKKSSEDDMAKSKARQLERYLNYMLEHPALSTSFPLNLILKASQSGLDAAKIILDEQSKFQQQNSNATNLSHGGTHSRDVEKYLSLPSSIFQYLPSQSQTKNLDWVRTAAQAALVLKVHGLLETAGYQSTSTKLQHASLPQFASSNHHGHGDTTMMDGGGANIDNASRCGHGSHKGAGNVDSAAGYDENECDGFDMLPEPLPTPPTERSALCAGSVYPSHTNAMSSEVGSLDANSMQEGYLYGAPQTQTSLGDMEVERDIDRLRDLLRSVDKGFASCCNAVSDIGEYRRSRALVQTNILRSLDSWEGMRGKILAQRSLLNGVGCLEAASRLADDSFAKFSEDILWNASLASAAVSASEDVCLAVDAARTASRAKFTADIAVRNANNAKKGGDIAPEELKSAKERFSRLKMQALHAAVVEHEAISAKKRSVISLANDVKCWNSHRKRELLRASTTAIEAQRLAAEQNLKAWNELKRGVLNSPHVFDIMQERHSDDVIESSTPQNSNAYTVQNEQKREEHDDDIIFALDHLDRSNQINHLEPNQDEDVLFGADELGYGLDLSIPRGEEDLYGKEEMAEDVHIAPFASKQIDHCRQPSSKNTPSVEQMENFEAAPKDGSTPSPLGDLENDKELIGQTGSNIDKKREKNSGIHFTPDQPEELGRNMVYQTSMSDHDEEDDIPFASNQIDTIGFARGGAGIDINQDYFTPTTSEPDIPCSDGEDDGRSSNNSDHGAHFSDAISSSSASQACLGSTVSGVNQKALYSDEGDRDVEVIAAEAEKKEEKNGMTDSMQSLVDGLLNWGGDWDSEDLGLTLPTGMAASLALEESGGLDLS